MADAPSRPDVYTVLSDAEAVMEAGILGEIGSRVHVRCPGCKIDAILSAYDGEKLGLRDAEHGYIVWTGSGVVLKTRIADTRTAAAKSKQEPTL
jgi:hypothetical protein